MVTRPQEPRPATTGCSPLSQCIVICKAYKATCIFLFRQHSRWWYAKAIRFESTMSATERLYKGANATKAPNPSSFVRLGYSIRACKD